MASITKKYENGFNDTAYLKTDSIAINLKMYLITKKNKSESEFVISWSMLFFFF